MTNKIWVYIDQFKGEALPASWEALGAGLTLAEELDGCVTALVFGQDVNAVAEEAIQYGADEILLADDATLADYRPSPYTELLTQLAADSEPDVILFPTTSRCRELAGMTAVDLETGVLVDVIEMDVEADQVVATRPIYAGKILSKVKCSAKPQIVTLRGRTFDKPEPDASRSGTVTPVEAALAEDEIAAKVVDYTTAEAGISLKDASVIVSGGRGVSNNPALEPPADISEEQQEVWKAEQGFALVAELANVLDAAVGASRAAVDAGYIAYEHQVGQTGKIVSPDVYIACGISGAIQHLAGMRTSKVIVAINKDPDAPIFNLARFGVVGDMHEIVPPLAEAMRARLE